VSAAANRANAGRCIVFFLFGCFVAAGLCKSAANAGEMNCRSAVPEPTAGRHVFNDPRSGLILHLDMDGRHMSATTPAGKIIWHRNLFDDPRLERAFPPPIQVPGEPPASNAGWRRQVHAYVSSLSIDRIALVPDCEKDYIDHHYPRMFRGHYVALGSGTHMSYLLNARTGDFLIDTIN